MVKFIISLTKMFYYSCYTVGHCSTIRVTLLTIVLLFMLHCWTLFYYSCYTVGY